MIIAVDIGNTVTKIGDSKHSWTIPTKKNQNSDSLRKQIQQQIDIDKIDAVSLCSVVPRLTDLWLQIFNDVYVLDINNNLFKTKYPYPNEIGGDIIAATIGATYFYNSPVIVIDFGTATNFCVIDDEAEFIGGVIIPGIDASLVSLIGKASLLKDIEIEFPPSAVGYSTEQAIQSGLILGETCRIDGLIDKIEDELGSSVNIITTGGWSKLISKHLKHKNINDTELLLKGLLTAYENR